MSVFLTNSKSKIYIKSIIIVTFLLFTCLFSFALQKSLDYFKEDLNIRFDSIEVNLNDKFDDVKSIMNKLSISVSADFIDHDRLHELLYVLKPFPGYKTSIPFSGSALLDVNGKIISDTITTSVVQRKLMTPRFQMCINNASKKPFELNIVKIVIGVLKEPIIPLVMTVADANQKNIAIICSGLLVKNLTEKLSMRYGNTKYVGNIELKNKDDLQGYAIDDMINLNTIIKSYLQDQNLVIHRLMRDYPFVLTVEIKADYFKRSLGRVVFLYLGFLVISLIAFYFLLYYIKNYIHNLLYPISNKISIMNSLLQEQSKDLIDSIQERSNDRFSLDEFSQQVESLIYQYRSLRLEFLKGSTLELKQKILNLVLTEQHFLPLNRSAITSEEKLYLNKMVSFINEKAINISLASFFTQVANYCSEFYNELQIRIISTDQDQRCFTFKRAALIETIFHIFSFTLRAGLNMDEADLVLRGEFVANNEFPTITIEVSSLNNQHSILGWEAGPDYVYTSLLSIYLLARENNLFFNLVKQKDKILFTLEPLDEKIHFYSKMLGS